MNIKKFSAVMMILIAVVSGSINTHSAYAETASDSAIICSDIENTNTIDGFILISDDDGNGKYTQVYDASTEVVYMCLTKKIFSGNDYNDIISRAEEAETDYDCYITPSGSNGSYKLHFSDDEDDGQNEKKFYLSADGIQKNLSYLHDGVTDCLVIKLREGNSDDKPVYDWCDGTSAPKITGVSPEDVVNGTYSSEKNPVPETSTAAVSTDENISESETSSIEETSDVITSTGSETELIEETSETIISTGENISESETESDKETSDINAETDESTEENDDEEDDSEEKDNNLILLIIALVIGLAAAVEVGIIVHMLNKR